MKLNDIVKDVLNDLKSRTKEWEILKDELKKRGLPNYKENIKKVDISEAGAFLTVLRKLRERFDYKTMDLGYHSNDQVENILKLSKVKGDVCNILDTLADIGYSLAYYYPYPSPVGIRKHYISYSDVGFVRKFVGDGCDIKKFLDVFNKLKNCFGLFANMEKDPSFYNTQVENLLELSKVKGDVCAMLDILVDSGYRFAYKSELKSNYIEITDLGLFKGLLEDDLFKKYSVVFKALNKGLGYNYEKVREIMHSSIQKIIQLSKLKGDVYGAIYILASEGYSIDKATDITFADMKGIEKIVKALNNKKDSSSLYIYKKGDVKIFKKFFSNLALEMKKKTLKELLDCDYHNEKIIQWLNEDYSEIIKETGLKSI